MMTTLSTKDHSINYKKGDIVAFRGDDLECAYVVKEIYTSDCTVLLYGIRLSEYCDDVINVQLCVNAEDVYPIDEAKINQIGYLMRILKGKIMKNEDIFAFNL